MIADFHLHYAMHVVPEQSGPARNLIASARGRAGLLDRVRAAGIHLGGRLANYGSFESGPRVTVPRMRAGGVGVGFSVLYSFWDEMDWPRGANSPPDPRYFSRVIRQLEAVEREIVEKFPDEAVVARSQAELDAGIESGKSVLVHCVEGAFHLGRDPDGIARNVAELAERGAAYVTVGHLFNRGVAEVANAIPFLPDPVWRLLFAQPTEPLLAPGRAAIRALADQRVMIDVSHMTEHAIDASLSLLDGIDPKRRVPVVATHAGYRFGDQQYMLCARHIEAIARRGGVIGLIVAEHQASDGLRSSHTRSLEDSVDVLSRHIDRIHELTGSHDHVAIGSDFDGFIKPTLAGLDQLPDMAALERALIDRYGAEDGHKIASGNLLRLLHEYWRS
jgi:microsomal dipeptidase-like Zn-dependent dipeptidase